MGVCRFFQSGSCRYGTKCHNEHFDIKEYLKADVESAFNGKMWPFSVYGPFKDKGNFPNFIEDQSFEEVRLMCYDAKRNNQFDQFHLQFTREGIEATNKMKSLLQTTPQIIDLMIKIYNAPEGTAPSAGATNSFGSAGLNNQSTSIFGKPTLSAGNIFGGNTAGSGPNSSSIFGGASQNQNPNSIFGGGVASTQNIFGQQQQQVSIFGNHQPSSTSIFSQQPQPQAPAQPSIFAQNTPQQQSPFTQPNTGSENIFANAQQANPFTQPNPGGQNTFGFGQSNQFVNQTQTPFTGFQQQPQQPQVQGFGQPAAPQAQAPPTGFFSQASAGYAPQQHSMQPMPTQTQSNVGLHTQLKDLSSEQMEAFKAELFVQGMVPFDAPPREFC